MSADDSARGALWGLAMGDALGMPTQLLSPLEIGYWFGHISRFEPAAPDHPIAAGMRAGSITDDTEQAVLLGRHLVVHRGHVAPLQFARELVDWEESMRARGSLDLLGPSTKAAVAAIAGGTPVDQAGRSGTTNGAAMRVTPVGIVVDANRMLALVDRVQEAALPTHNTGLAIASSSAVAAAVSAGIEGATLAQAFGAGIEAARMGADRGAWVAGADVAARIELALSLADPSDAEASEARVRDVIGTSLASQESVPAAFGMLAIHPGDPWRACTAAASLGGDTDTIAAMAGAIGGAVYGIGALPGEAIETLREVNRIDLGRLAADLLALR